MNFKFFLRDLESYENETVSISIWPNVMKFISIRALYYNTSMALLREETIGQVVKDSDEQ